MLDPDGQTIYDLLLDSGKCTKEQLDAAAEEFENGEKSYKEIVIDFGLTEENTILQLIGDSLGLEVVDLEIYGELSRDLIKLIDAGTARKEAVVPLALDDNVLTIVLRNPLNYQAVDEFRFVLGKEIIQVIAPENQVDAAIEKYYPVDLQSTMHDVLQELSDKRIELSAPTEEEDSQDLEAMANEAPIVKFVDAILYQAIKDKASDIHFEPFETIFKIRCRVDGALYEMAPPPKSLALPVISRIKILADLNISERRKPQDGRIHLKVGGKPIDLRVSCLPTYYGESVVLRVLDRSVVNLDLDALGINEANLSKVRDIIIMPNGIFIVTGPTGSGKTTTLYSALKEVNDPESKLLTAEDPVEYDLEGIIQLPINDAVGMTFHRALRAFLRQDPDIIMLGEIRDLESARMAVEASLTGHFVFSTLHTNDAAGTVTRLIDMGVEPFLIASSLVGVLSQRLIRRVCPQCKTAYVPTDDDLKLLDLEREDVGEQKFYYGKGCSNCNGTGYRGRMAITELLTMNTQINELVLKSSPTVVIRDKARELGMMTMREDGVRAILQGLTSMEEVLKYT
ncbi:MAG: type II/IV secretion system protein [Lentisphaeria bacterium]|nr:type II/IV secretion system protein [Lentisphaeria bacterium]